MRVAQLSDVHARYSSVDKDFCGLHPRGIFSYTMRVFSTPHAPFMPLETSK